MGAVTGLEAYVTCLVRRDTRLTEVRAYPDVERAGRNVDRHRVDERLTPELALELRGARLREQLQQLVEPLLLELERDHEQLLHRERSRGGIVVGVVTAERVQVGVVEHDRRRSTIRFE